MNEPKSSNGLSDHELLLELRNDVQALRNIVQNSLLQRPTRGEIMGLLAGAGVVSGIVFGIINVASRM